MPGLDELWTWVRTPVQELVARRAGGPDMPWADLRAYFVERTGVGDPSGHALLGPLVRQLDEMPDSERMALLADGDKFETHVYELATTVAEPPADAQSYDETAWQRFLVENGPRWAGDEGSWDQFNAWFTYQADEAGVGQPATALMAHLGTLGVAERITTFAQYGVRIAAPAETAADEGGWQRFLAENGPRWAGDEASWDQFHAWFTYQAQEQGFGVPATELAKRMAGRNAAERITVFADYGVRIAGQPVAADQAPVELTEQDLQSIFDQTADFADIPEERRKELIREIAGGR
ncbi:MAG TPA: hypothetical protein VFW65_16215 [Pseudonocardiaceae bacterium]|nr:hypothetical protein [Pseudonocardiaceae bacterium]